MCLQYPQDSMHMVVSHILHPKVHLGDNWSAPQGSSATIRPHAWTHTATLDHGLLYRNVAHCWTGHFIAGECKMPVLPPAEVASLCSIMLQQMGQYLDRIDGPAASDLHEGIRHCRHDGGQQVLLEGLHARLGPARLPGAPGRCRLLRFPAGGACVRTCDERDIRSNKMNERRSASGCALWFVNITRTGFHSAQIWMFQHRTQSLLSTTGGFRNYGIDVHVTAQKRLGIVTVTRRHDRHAHMLLGVILSLLCWADPGAGAALISTGVPSRSRLLPCHTAADSDARCCQSQKELAAWHRKPSKVHKVHKGVIDTLGDWQHKANYHSNINIHLQMAYIFLV
jgi:hypothetical protein